jgi:hypothetical protein
MKYLAIVSLLFAGLICQTSAASEKAVSSKGKQGAAPRVQEKAVTARTRRGLMQGHKPEPITLLLRVETRMENGKQMIVAKATTHVNGATGPLRTVDSLEVRISAPTVMRRDGGRTNTASTAASIPAPDGKFKSVTADAGIMTVGMEDTRVTVTVPGDQ